MTQKFEGIESWNQEHKPCSSPSVSNRSQIFGLVINPNHLPKQCRFIIINDKTVLDHSKTHRDFSDSVTKYSGFHNTQTM